MTMNPDIKDPAWIKQREAQWKTLEAFLKSDVRRSALKNWRKVFFAEEEFDFGNAQKYGEGANNCFNCLMGFTLYPIQMPERWEYFINVLLRKWWHEKWYLRNLQDLVRSLSNLSGEDLRTWGWDLETQVELQRFLLGDRFMMGEYELCGNKMKYPVTANWFHGLWIDQSVFWLQGSIVYPDVRSHYLIGYWVSCLEYLHPLFFEPRLLRSYAVMLPQMRLKFLMAYCKSYDLDAIRAQRQQEKLREIDDNGQRQAFLNELKTVFETADLPAPMKRLWQMAKEEKDFGPQSHGELPESEDPSRLLEPDEFNKIFL